jgi:hypothetical protein
MQRAQKEVFSRQAGAASKEAGLTDEQKNSFMDKVQGEVLSKGLPLTFLFATLVTIANMFAG